MPLTRRRDTLTTRRTPRRLPSGYGYSNKIRTARDRRNHALKKLRKIVRETEEQKPLTQKELDEIAYERAMRGI